MISILLTRNEVDLILRTIVAIEIEGNIGDLIKRSMDERGGKRIHCTYEELDELVGSVAIEVRGFERVQEERTNRADLPPEKGSVLDELTRLHKKLDKHLT